MFPVRPSVWLEVQRLESGESGVSASMYIVILSYRRRRKVTPLYVRPIFKAQALHSKKLPVPKRTAQERSHRELPQKVSSWFGIMLVAE